MRPARALGLTGRAVDTHLGGAGARPVPDQRDVVRDAEGNDRVGVRLGVAIAEKEGVRFRAIRTDQGAREQVRAFGS